MFSGTCLGVDVDDGGVEDEQPSPPPLRGELRAAGKLAPHAVSPSVGGEGEGGGSNHITASAANRLIGEVVQSRRRPLLGPSPG